MFSFLGRLMALKKGSISLINWKKCLERNSRNRTRVEVVPKGLHLQSWKAACRQFLIVYVGCVASPQSSVLSRSSSRYDFGDEDAGVVAYVGVVGSSCYAEAEAWVTLQEQKQTRCQSSGSPWLWRAATAPITKASEMQTWATHSLQCDLLVFNFPLCAIHLSEKRVG